MYKPCTSQFRVNVDICIIYIFSTIIVEILIEFMYIHFLYNMGEIFRILNQSQRLKKKLKW